MDRSHYETPLTSVSVEEALEAILSHFAPLEAVSVPFTEALGLVLAEDVRSDMDSPPFDNSSMDGYAVRAGDTLRAGEGEPAKLRVVGYMPAGKFPRPEDRVESGTAIRIMTGAPMPPGADAVVPFEDTNEGAALNTPRLQPGNARAIPSLVGSDVLIYKAVGQGSSVRRAGEDMRASELVLQVGTLIRPAEIGVLASVGKTTIPVHRRPKVAILASGDELVDAGEKPGPGQIRNSNNYAVAAQITSWGGEAINLGIARDSVEHVTAKINEALELQPDLLITSAGVSVGDLDVVKDGLMSLGSISMWRVRVKPGKPLAFGRIYRSRNIGQHEGTNPQSAIRNPQSDGVPFLGLPGNPVSSMVSMELFGRPAILKMLGRRDLYRPFFTARALEPIDGAPGRAHYVRAIVTQEGDQLVARTTGKQDSNLLTSMSHANALLVLDENTRRVEAGEMVRGLMLE